MSFLKVLYHSFYICDGNKKLVILLDIPNLPANAIGKFGHHSFGLVRNIQSISMCLLCCCRIGFMVRCPFSADSYSKILQNHVIAMDNAW